MAIIRGLVHILPAMESCSTYKPWHDKKTGETYLKPDHGRCLHYYFYFIDEKLGLGYVADMVSVPAANLFQWPWLVSGEVTPTWNRLHPRREWVLRDRGLERGAATGRRVDGRDNPPGGF